MKEREENNARFRYSLKQLMLVAVLVGAVITTIQQYRLIRTNRQLKDEVARLSDENQELQNKLLLQRLADNLKIPTPALYHRYLPVRDLHRMRVDALRAAGVKRCPPISALQRHNMDHADLSFLLSPNIYRIDDGPVSMGTFWEGAEGQAASGVSTLSAYLRGTPGFREWLVGERELLQEYIRPLLLRIARAPDPRNRYEAIETMLLLGDRSPDILMILRQSIARLADEPDDLTESERLRFHDVDPTRAKELISEFKLGESIEELR